MTLLIDDFIEDLHKSAYTRDGYRSDLLRFDRFLDGEEPTEDLAREYIRFLVKKGNKGATIARAGYAIRRYFKWAHIPLDLELPSLGFNNKPNYFTEEEIDKLLQATRTPFERVLVMLLYESGMRIGELLGIREKDINWENGVISITRKGGRPGKIAIGEATLQAIVEHMNWMKIKRGYIFPYTYYEVRRWFQQIGKRAGVEIHGLHTMRHSRAVHLRLAGQPIEDISDILGHSNLAVTEKVYAQIEPVALRDRVRKPFWEKSDAEASG